MTHSARKLLMLVAAGAIPGGVAVASPAVPHSAGAGARGVAGALAPEVGPAGSRTFCAADGPEYYAFPLITTKNVPGTGLAIGTAEVSFSGTSPFSVALAPDGSYEYDVRVSLERMKPPTHGRLVAWVTTTDLAGIGRLGPLDEQLRAEGRVAWNKFLVVITLEPSDDPGAVRWTGPIVFRGMSRSGMMHTMVGHGAFQQENCAAYGYGN